MYEYIKGTLIESNPMYVVLEANDIGYKIFISLSCFTTMPNLNEKVCLYISPIIKEDSHTLFGFLSKEKKELFEQVRSVSGIGPKTALTLVGNLDKENFQDAILNGNINLISKVRGIGKKTAERLIIELRDKFKNIPKGLAFSNKQKQSPAYDATAALVNLGYHHIQAQKAIKKVIDETKEEDVGSLISLALKKL